MQHATAPALARASFLTIVLAYAGFVALGLTNSMMGVAWPSIRDTFSQPLDALGIILTASTIGYMSGSAGSARVVGRVGVGTTLAASCALMALAMLGTGGAPAWVVLMAMSLLSGLGAGLIDAGLNTYAATYFSPRAMNWLHACFGVGATVGPAIMTAAVAGGFGWRIGYFVVGVVQVLLTVCFVATRNSWQVPMAASADQPEHGATFGETLRLPLAWLGIAIFLAYTGSEITPGTWGFSLLTESRGVDAALAGTWISLYWGSLTLGRIVVGAIANLAAPRTILRASMIAAVAGSVLLWLNAGPWVSFLGLAVLGFALAPQFPMLISATPRFLGPRHAANGVGFEVAAAGFGGAILPSLVGVLAKNISLEVIGPFMVVATTLMLVLFEILARVGQWDDKR